MGSGYLLLNDAASMSAAICEFAANPGYRLAHPGRLALRIECNDPIVAYVTWDARNPAGHTQCSGSPIGTYSIGMTKLRAMLICPSIVERNVAIGIEKYSRKFVKLIIPIPIFVISRLFCPQREL
jgi:hypothetical protein